MQEDENEVFCSGCYVSLGLENAEKMVKSNGQGLVHWEFLTEFEKMPMSEFLEND